MPLKCCLFQEACRPPEQKLARSLPRASDSGLSSKGTNVAALRFATPSSQDVGCPQPPPSASPGATCLVSPEQVGSYKGRQGRHGQLCTVSVAGPGAGLPSTVRTPETVTEGIWVTRWSSGPHGDQLPAAKGLNSEPLQELNLHPDKGKKTPIRTETTPSARFSLRIWEPAARRAFPSPKSHRPGIYL